MERRPKPSPPARVTRTPYVPTPPPRATAFNHRIKTLSHTVERVFLGWDGPALPAAAVHIIEHYIDGTVADLRPATLVLPGGRARRRVIELLLDAAEARGATLIPPRTTTVGGLPELLMSGTPAVADEVSSRRAWSRALRG